MSGPETFPDVAALIRATPAGDAAERQDQNRI
jgi:hypothetical protein